MGFVPADAATKGGYARPLTPEEQAEQAKMVAEHLKTQDIVVTTAQIPGRKAPRIVTAEMVKSMKAGAVVLDMAAESGGNVEGSVPGETVEVGGVKLIGARNLPGRIAPPPPCSTPRTCSTSSSSWSTRRARSSRSTPMTS